MPTILAAAGVPAPAGLPGVDLLDEKAVAARDTLFLANYTHDMASPDDPGSSLLTRSCLRGNWKLIEWREKLPENGRHVGKVPKNPGAREEPFDLAAKQPERVKELAARLEGWWKPSARPKGG